MKNTSGTNWAKIESLGDEDIDCSDIPELGEGFFAQAAFWPGRKQQVTLRIDPDVLDFFRQQGRGYQRNINAILRRYMEIKKSKPSL